MLAIFNIMLERGLKTGLLLKTVFIRTDKCDITVQQKWLTMDTHKNISKSYPE